MSITNTLSETITIIHSRYVSSKIASDLDLCRLYYDRPYEARILEYKEELTQLLKDGYVSEYEFGFKRDGKRVICWRYTVKTDGTISTDDHPGKIYPWVDLKDATFYNFLTYSLKWFWLSPSERERIEQTLPFRRTDGSLPSDGNGYWTSDRSYCSAGLGVTRQTFKPLS